MIKKKHIRNRILACFLAAAMIIGEIPAAALKVYAKEEAQTEVLSESGMPKESGMEPEAAKQADSEDASNAAALESETSKESLKDSDSEADQNPETETISKAETAKKAESSDTKTASETVETETTAKTETAETETAETESTADAQESETAPAESKEPPSSEDASETYDSDEYAKAGDENPKLDVSTRVGTKFFKADIYLTLTDESVYDSYGETNLFYKEASAATWERKPYDVYFISNAIAHASCEVTGLNPSTKYEYYIKCTRYGIDYGSESEPKTFTTNEFKTYQDSDFPDEAFRSFIRSKLSLSYSSAPITSDKLETLTELRASIGENTNENISSLKGIEHMPFLTNIYFDGHTIADASYISGLTKLEVIFFKNNDLKQLPDLSKMPDLTTAFFDNNKIAENSFKQEKLPAKLLEWNPDWIANTKKNQRGEVAYKIAPEYYSIGEGESMRRPFAIKATDLKKEENRLYTLSLTIGGKTASVTQSPDYYDDMYYIGDIASDITVTEKTPQSANIKLTDNYGTIWLDINKELVFVPGINVPTAQTSYISPFTKECRLAIPGIPPDVTDYDIKSIILKDKSGKKVGEADLGTVNTNFELDNYNPYEKIFGLNKLSGITQILSDVKMNLSEYLSAGDYSAILTIGEKEYNLEKAVCVPDGAQLTGLSLFDDSRDRDENDNDINFKYDNYGDYWYVEISGANIDPDKVWPVFYEGDKDITEVAGASQIYGGGSRAVIYKLKKLEKDKYWRESGEKAFRIEKADGYNVINDIRGKTLYYDYENTTNYVLFRYYDKKTQRCKIKLNTKIPDGTVMDISLYDQSAGTVSEHSQLLATARETVKDGWISPDFKNSNDQPYTLDEYKARNLISCSYTDAEGNTINFVNTSNFRWDGFLNDFNHDFITGYSLDTEQNIFPVFKSLNIVRTCSPVSGQTLPIFKSTDEGYVEAGQASFTPKGSLISNTLQEYNISLSASDSKGVDAGYYVIRNGSNYVLEFYVYDPKVFYMDGRRGRCQELSTWTDGDGNVKGLEVRILSANIYSDYVGKYNKNLTNEQALKYWKDNNYNIEFFDYFKNKVDGWSIAEAGWKGNTFSLKVEGLNNAVGYYVRVTKDGKPGKCIHKDETLYEHWSDPAAINYTGNDLGMWQEIQDWFRFEFSDGRCYAFTNDRLAAYPLTVALTPPYDIVPAAEFTINEPNAQNYNTMPMYYFTAEDLKDIDKDTLYRLRVTDKDGRIIYDNNKVGYFWHDETRKPVNPTPPPTVDPEANISITGIEGDGVTGSYPEYYVEMGKDSSKTATLRATLTGASNLTAASSDTKVVAIGSATASNGAYTIPLTIKSAGAAEITLTADDSKRTKKSIWLYAENTTPLISTDLLTVNLKQTAGPRFFIYPPSGYTVSSASFGNDADFTLERVEGFKGMCWRVMLKKDNNGKTIAAAKKTYNLNIEGELEKNGQKSAYSPLPVKIKTVDAPPKYKISQREKINLFFKDGRTLLNISSNVALDSIELPENCGFKVEKETDKKGTARYYLKAKAEKTANTSAIQALLKTGKTIKFKITFSGYEPIDNINYTVNAEYKIPKLALSSKSATFYLNANSAVISVMNGKEKFALPDGTAIKCVRNAGKPTEEEITEFKAEAKDGSIFIENTAPGNAGKFSMQLKLTNSIWSDPWHLPYTATVKNTDEPAVKLSKATLKLNANASVRGNDIATTELIWKDGVRFNADAGSFKCDGKDAKSQGVRGKIDITYENDIITAKLKDKVDKGTYKFNATLDIKGKDGNPLSGIQVAIPFSIAISEDAPENTIQLSQKGAIDVLNREGTYIAVTPALKSINGTVANPVLSDAAPDGTDAAKFSASIDDDGKIRIQLKKDASDLALNKDYILKLSLTVTNADRETTPVTPSKPIKFKLKQGKPKVALTPTGATFFSGKEISLERDVAVTLAGAQNPPEIAGMKLDDSKNSLPFTVNYENGILTITSDKKAKAKTYKLPFIVTFKDQVGIEGIVKVSYSVNVK